MENHLFGHLQIVSRILSVLQLKAQFKQLVVEAADERSGGMTVGVDDFGGSVGREEVVNEAGWRGRSYWEDGLWRVMLRSGKRLIVDEVLHEGVVLFCLLCDSRHSNC
jgi:hypothetical protein